MVKEVHEFNIQKLNEFYACKELDKYMVLSTYTFSDGMFLSKFWLTEQDFIKNSNLDICKKITRDYNEYIRIQKDKQNIVFNKKLEEFANYSGSKGYTKFFSSLPRFKNDAGTLKAFWDVNKSVILKSNDDLSKKVINQYKLACIMQRNIQMKQANLIEPNTNLAREFLLKLKEFNMISNLEKFSLSEHITFEDGTSTFAFWKENRKMIKKSENAIFKTTKTDYKAYCKIYENPNDKLFQDRIMEFYNMSNVKFISRNGSKFVDGVNVYSWWNNKKPIIKEKNLEMYLKISEQYECFKGKEEMQEKYIDDNNKKVVKNGHNKTKRN